MDDIDFFLLESEDISEMVPSWLITPFVVGLEEGFEGSVPLRSEYFLLDDLYAGWFPFDAGFLDKVAVVLSLVLYLVTFS